jgi:hypothetical protein
LRRFTSGTSAPVGGTVGGAIYTLAAGIPPIPALTDGQNTTADAELGPMKKLLIE